MTDSTATSGLAAAPQISLDLKQNKILIRVQNHLTFDKYNGHYSFETLPIEFKVLFQNLNQFFEFLSEHTEERLRVGKGILYITVNIIGKDKEFGLPLEEIELSPEEQLRKQLWQRENQLSQQGAEIHTLQNEVKDKQGQLQQKQKIIFTMSEVLREKDSELAKMDNKVRSLENQLQDLLFEYKGHKLEHQMQESKMTEEFTPVKKAANYSSKSKKLKEIEEFGRKLLLKVDQSAKYFSKFNVSANQVQKLHGPTYQLFHIEPLPRQGKFYFDMRIILIKNNNIVVGVITEKNKDEQFSFKKMNCVCYNGYDGSICQQDKQKYVNVKPKEGNKIRTVVDLNNGTIEWYIMGGEMQKLLIGKTLIPHSMAKQQLFPYFELYWEGNKVRLNA